MREMAARPASAGGIHEEDDPDYKEALRIIGDTVTRVKIPVATSNWMAILRNGATPCRTLILCVWRKMRRMMYERKAPPPWFVRIVFT